VISHELPAAEQDIIQPDNI